MKLLAPIVLLSSISLIGAIPVNNNAMIKRDKPNGALCQIRTDGSDNQFYRVYTWGPWDQDWGASLLANLRKQCPRNINDWKFDFQAGVPPTDGTATFWFTEGSAKCVQDAIWLASNAAGSAIWNVNCYYGDY